MYSCKKLWEWASASNRFLHTSSLHKKLKLGLWECYIECNKCEISSHGQQNLLTFSVNILNNCSGMPAPRTSQCQDSLDSLSGWMACFPVNTAYRAARAPFFFSGSEVKSGRFGGGEAMLLLCYTGLLCLCFWGFHTPFSSTTFYEDLAHLGFFLWTHLPSAPAICVCVELGRAGIPVIPD